MNRQPVGANRLRILQINLNKSEAAHLDLLNGPLGRDWDVVLIQEPHVTHFQTIRTPAKFRQVYPANRGKEGTTVRSGIWVNAEIDTKSWKTLKIPDTNDITAIQMTGQNGDLTIFNIYNDCRNTKTEDALRKYLRENANEIWRGPDKHMLWCGDFNRHHPLWDRDEDTHLFTTDALNKASRLIELLADYGMDMLLPKGVPTLQHMRSKRYSRPDNVFGTRSIANSVTRCVVKAAARPTKTDHFPIITVLELPQERVRPTPSYDFRMADWDDFRENLQIRLTEIPEPRPLLNEDEFRKAALDLTEALQDTIRTRIEIKKPAPHSRRWWTSELSTLKRQLNKLNHQSYKFRALTTHPSHDNARELRNELKEAIKKAKEKHWRDFLEEAQGGDV